MKFALNGPSPWAPTMAPMSIRKLVGDDHFSSSG